MNPIVDKATTVVAAGAVASPWWLEWLSNVSEIAALLLPIAGLIWLIVQVVMRLTKD